MVTFRSRFERNLFWAAFVVASLLFVNGFLLGNDLFSTYSNIANKEGRVPYSDNFEKGVLDPAYITGGGRIIPSNDNLGRASVAPVVFGDGCSDGNVPCLDVDGLPYFVLAPGNVQLTQDLRGKTVRFDYRMASICNGDFCEHGTINANCGNFNFGRGPDDRYSTGQVEIISSDLNDDDYVFLVNGQQVCAGSLKDGEKLTMGTAITATRGAFVATYRYEWVYPFICRRSGNLDLAFEDFSAGETVTLTGSTQRIVKGLCPELAPLLISQKEGGVQSLPELNNFLATPPKGSLPYIVPDDSILRLSYWTLKDDSVPTACVDSTLTKAFNLDTKKCDDIINIRNFCTEGIIFNNECLTPSDASAKFNCQGTVELVNNVPVCYESRTRTGVSAYCKPSLGGIDPITGKCPDGKDPYTSYDAACLADGGKPEGDWCIKDLAITFEDPATGQPVATAPYNPTTGFGNYQFNPGTPSTVQDSLKERSTVTSISESDILPYYEQVLRKVYFGLKLKAWLLLLSVLTIIVIVFRSW